MERDLILKVRTFARISSVLEGHGEQNYAHGVAGLCVEAARGAVLFWTDDNFTYLRIFGQKKHYFIQEAIKDFSYIDQFLVEFPVST